LIFQEEKVKQKAAQILGLLVMTAALAFASNMPASRLENLVNYPNPFDSRKTDTTIAYRLTEEAPVTVRIFDVLGQRVREWNFGAGENGARAGFNAIAWDGASEDGKKLATGVYVCLVEVSGDSGASENWRKIGLIR
jgi:hypothetical protein